MSNMNIEQLRAAYALSSVKAGIKEFINKEGKENIDKWLSRANELPAMIQMNGIGATVDFYQMKGTGAHESLLKILTGWLCGTDDIYRYTNLMDAIVNGDMHTYRAAQAEAQALLVWVKKFSKIYCTDTETTEAGQS